MSTSKLPDTVINPDLKISEKKTSKFGHMKFLLKQAIRKKKELEKVVIVH